MWRSQSARICSEIRILVVDDEPAFRESLADALRDDGHAVETYDSAEALPALDALGDVGLLITDYQMPGRDGVALADAFHARHSAVPIIMVSADDTTRLHREVARRAWLDLYPKVVDYDALHALIHHRCDAPPA